MIVVDVGNSRIKWGRASEDGVHEIASLVVDEEAWDRQWQSWTLMPEEPWLIGSVHPASRNRLQAWLRKRGPKVHVVEEYRQVPLLLDVDLPERVGLDRLFNAVAVKQRRRPGAGALVLDAGTAITIDLVDRDGVFRGGAILPGLKLMSRALKDHTAVLPQVSIQFVPPPGRNTDDAIRVGVFHAALGAAECLAQAYRTQCAGALEVYFTGGDAEALAARWQSGPCVLWPEMTLEGVYACRQNMGLQGG